MATPPLLEASDCLESGNNTATTSWPVSHQDYSAGDLLVFHVSSDADVTHNWPATGPNGETINTIKDSIGGTAQRASGFWFVGSATTAAGTLTVTPSATEQWTAVVLKVLAGEFDPANPIQALTGEANDTGADANWETPSWTTDAVADGRVVCFAAHDTVTTTGTPAGWTTLIARDRGACGCTLAARDAGTTSAEVIASVSFAKTSETDSSFGYVINGGTPPEPPAGWTILTKSGSITNGTSFNTAAISPTPGAQVLIGISSMGYDTGDRRAPASVGDFVLVDSAIVGTYTMGSVWEYKSDTPFSGTVPMLFGTNTQDIVEWIVIERTGAASIGTPVKASGTSVNPAPGTIGFAGEGAETIAFNFWGNPGSATIRTHTADPDFHEFDEQAGADSGWYTALAVQVATDQQTTCVSTLSASETWASIAFEVTLAAGGSGAVLEGDAVAVASATGTLTGGTALPAVRAGFPVVADGAAEAEPYTVTSDTFSANAGDELTAYAIGGGLPAVTSRNSADTGAGTLNWIRRFVTRVDYTNTSTNAAGAQQVAVYTAVVPAGGVTERARLTTAAVANDNGDAVNPNLPARLIVVAVDNTNGLGAINWRGSVGGSGSEVTTGLAATQTIKPFGLNSLLLGAGWFINGTAPTPVSGCTEVIAPGTNRMPLYSRIGGAAGAAVALGSAATDGTLWALGLVEYLPTTTPKPARKILVIGDSNVESTHAALSVATYVQDALAPDFEVFQQGVWWAHVAQARARWDEISATMPEMDVALVNIGTNDVNETLAWSSGNQSDMTAIFSGLEAAGLPCAVFTGIGPLAGAGAPQAYYDARDWLTANAPDGAHLWSIDPIADVAQNRLAVDADYLSADAKHINSAGDAILGADLVTWIEGLTFSTPIELTGAAITVVSASGALTTQIPLAGAAVSVSGAGASLTAHITLTGSALAVALASAGLSTGAGLSGGASGQAAATATLTTTILIAGSAAGQAGGSAGLTTQIPLTGSAIAHAAATGSLEVDVSLAADATAQAAATGSLATQIVLDGDALAAASASGGLLTAILLAGAGHAESSAQASLTALIQLGAVSVATASATGQLTTQIPLGGAALSVASADGDITAQITLTGAALAVALGAATLTSGSGLSGAALAGAQAAATLTTSILITAGAGAQANALGELTTQIPLSAAAVATALATGSLEIEIPLAGNAIAQASAGGQISTGIALAGIATAGASATGALSQGQSLAGAAVALSSADGNLLAQIRLSAEALAAAQASGSLEAIILLSGQALALATAAGNLTLPINLAGAAQSEAAAVGALTTHIDLAGHAAAQATATGTPWLDILLAGAAVVSASASAVLTTPPRFIAVSLATRAEKIVSLMTHHHPIIRLTGSTSRPIRLATEACHV